MISANYIYFISSLLSFIPWLFTFFLRKDLRKEVLIMSFAVAVGSLVTSYFWWTFDWWHPITIFYTRVGIEDFLIGFTSGGIAAVLFKEIFILKKSQKRTKNVSFALITFATIFLIGMSFFTWVMHLSSFLSYSITMIFLYLIIIIQRKDLFLFSIINGFLVVIVMVIFIYLPIIILFPSWIKITWDLQELSNIFVWKIPIEDIIFYFLLGLVVGPFYSYWKGHLFLRKL